MKKISTSGKIVVIIVSLIIGFLGGGFYSVFSNNPDSYTYPDFNNHSHQEDFCGEIDVDVIKNKELSIHFIELGNKYTGDCTLINIGDVEILIDAGSRADSVLPIKNYIDTYINGELDYVIVTHAHQDHYAGFATGVNTDSLFDLYDVGTIIEFAQTNQKQDATSGLFYNYRNEKEQLKNKMEGKGKTLNIWTALDCINGTNGATDMITLGDGISLQILNQKYYTEKASTENNYSVCCQLIQTDGVNTKYYLFTGDLEEAGEASLISLNSSSLHQVELYKAGHHGSKTSSSKALMEIVQPKKVCVCCCAGSSEYTVKNENQFPTQEFINNIAPYTNIVLVTTLCVDYSKNEFTSFNGNIVITSNKSETNVDYFCSNNTTLLKDTEWFTLKRVRPAEW